MFSWWQSSTVFSPSCKKQHRLHIWNINFIFCCFCWLCHQIWGITLHKIPHVFRHWIFRSIVLVLFSIYQLQDFVCRSDESPFQDQKSIKDWKLTSSLILHEEPGRNHLCRLLTKEIPAGEWTQLFPMNSYWFTNKACNWGIIWSTQRD